MNLTASIVQLKRENCFFRVFTVYTRFQYTRHPGHISLLQIAPCLRRCSSGRSQLHLLNERLESLHEILNAQFFALPLLIHAGDLLWWNKKATNYLDDSVFGDTIFDNHLGESVYFDADDAAKAENIDA